MILYLLDHRHWIDAEYYDTKLIGIFSSRSIALNIVERYSKLPGFCDSKFNFHIETFDVSQNKKKIKKGTIYLLTTTQVLDDDEITVSYRLYTNIFLAKLTQIIKSIVLRGKSEKKLYLSQHCIDRADWSEGFVSMN